MKKAAPLFALIAFLFFLSACRYGSEAVSVSESQGLVEEQVDEPSGSSPPEHGDVSTPPRTEAGSGDEICKTWQLGLDTGNWVTDLYTFASDGYFVYNCNQGSLDALRDYSGTWEMLDESTLRLTVLRTGCREGAQIVEAAPYAFLEGGEYVEAYGPQAYEVVLLGYEKESVNDAFRYLLLDGERYRVYANFEEILEKQARGEALLSVERWCLQECGDSILEILEKTRRYDQGNPDSREAANAPEAADPPAREGFGLKGP